MNTKDTAAFDLVLTEKQHLKVFASFVVFKGDFAPCSLVLASKNAMEIRPVAFAFLLLASLAPVAGAKRARKSLVLMRTGVITDRDSERTYSFRARRGQTISANVSSKTPGFYTLLFITSPSGLMLTPDKNTSYSARLSETGVYRVRAGVNFMATQTTSGAYRLFVRVR